MFCNDVLIHNLLGNFDGEIRRSFVGDDDSLHFQILVAAVTLIFSRVRDKTFKDRSNISTVFVGADLGDTHNREKRHPRSIFSFPPKTISSFFPPRFPFLLLTADYWLHIKLWLRRIGENCDREDTVGNFF